MTPILERLLWASLAGIPTGILALLLCRLPRLAPLAKVWICRLALVKFAFSLLTTSAIALTVHTPVSGLGTQTNDDFRWLALWLGAIWVCGIAVVLRHMNISRRHAAALISFGKKPDDATAAVVNRLAKRMAVRQEVQVRRSSCSQPLIIGWRKKTIMLPASGEDATDEGVLCHELAHAKHRDLEWLFSVNLILAVLWFHPMVALLEQELRLWQEAAADTAARRTVGVEPKRQAESIVRALATAAKHERTNMLAMGQFGGAATVVRRLRELYQPKHSACLCVLACLLVLPTLVPVRLSSKASLKVTPSAVSLGPDTPTVADRVHVAAP